MSRSVHRLIFGLCVLVGSWSIISFFGAVFAPGGPENWILSLVAALVSGLLLIPTIIVANQLLANRSETQSNRETILPTHFIFGQRSRMDNANGEFASTASPEKSLRSSE